jgi:hypothetical protein
MHTSRPSTKMPSLSQNTCKQCKCDKRCDVSRFDTSKDTNRALSRPSTKMPNLSHNLQPAQMCDTRCDTCDKCVMTQQAGSTSTGMDRVYTNASLQGAMLKPAFT